MDICWDAVARRMRIARLALGITEREAAAAWRVTLRTYRKWEGGSPPSVGHLELLLLCEKIQRQP
jgi:hypothetical protein